VKIDLGQTIGILANAGVIAGIAFLALEIQQNTAVQESQMRFDQNERQTEVIEEIFRNADLRAALLKNINGEPLRMGIFYFRSTPIGTSFPFSGFMVRFSAQICRLIY